MRALYTVLLTAAVPFILARLYWRGRKNPDYRQRIPERFGCYPARSKNEEIVWIHAVSVGEVESAVPLVRKLATSRPDLRILFTTTTPTGSARVKATFGDGVDHCYLPYDLPVCVDRFLRHFRPRLAVILETEIWPNLYAGCASNAIPLVIVNGRLSQRSATGYRRIGMLVRETLAHVTTIATQTENDARRFISIGAKAERVTSVGNIKFDLEMPEDVLEQGQRDRRQLFPGRPVLIAASTHEGEEQQILSVFAELLQRFPRLLLIFVPRHPERFPIVASLCQNSGYSLVPRSAGRPCARNDQIFLLDSMGELKRFYAAADAAFVGGSLVPVGGHNVLEPAAAGIPVLFGPHVDNFQDICSALVAAGGALQCKQPSAVVRDAMALLESPEQREAMGARARSFVAANRGALVRIMALLENYLPTAAPGPVT